MATPIRKLGLWPSIESRLSRLGITTAEELSTMTAVDLMEPGFGISRMVMIDEALWHAGFRPNRPPYSWKAAELFLYAVKDSDPFWRDWLRLVYPSLYAADGTPKC
jgi:hypothetical protein